MTTNVKEPEWLSEIVFTKGKVARKLDNWKEGDPLWLKDLVYFDHADPDEAEPYIDIDAVFIPDKKEDEDLDALFDSVEEEQDEYAHPDLKHKDWKYYRQLATHLFNKDGIKPVFIRDKNPSINGTGWGDATASISDQSEIGKRAEELRSSLNGVGVLLGPPSGNLVDFDVDTLDDGHTAQVREVFDKHLPGCKNHFVGGKGFHCLVRTENDIAEHKGKYVEWENGDHVETRYSNIKDNGDLSPHQSVYPGSWHPDGKHYRFLDDDVQRAFEYKINTPDIPTLTDEQYNSLLDDLRKLNPAKTKPSDENKNTSGDDGHIDLETISVYKKEFKYTAEEIKDAFNKKHDIATLLQNAGYTHVRGDYYKHPHDDSNPDGSAHILKGNGVFLFGAKDPLRGKGTGEDNSAFDAYGFYVAERYGDDKKRALKEIAASMGMDGYKESEEEIAEPKKDPDRVSFRSVRNKNLYRIDLDKLGLPESFLELVAAIRQEAYNRDGTAFAFAGFLLSSIAGKKVKVSIGPATIYTALRIVDLDGTGKSKSPALRSCMQMVEPFATDIESIGSCSLSSFFKVRGTRVSEPTDAKLRKMDEKEREMIQDLINTGQYYKYKKEQLRNKHKAAPAKPIVVDDGFAFIKSMTCFDQPKDYLASFCNLADENSDITYETVSQGYYFILDPCIPMFLNSTISSYATFMHDTKAADSGAVYRLLPVNSQEVEFCSCKFRKNAKDRDKFAAYVLSGLRGIDRLVEEVDSIIVDDIPFDTKDDDNGEIDMQEEVCSKNKFLKKCIFSLDEKTLDNIRPKAAVYAKKLAALIGVYESAEDLRREAVKQKNNKEAEINLYAKAGKYYPAAFEIVMLCYLTAYLSRDTQNDELEDVIKIQKYCRDRLLQYKMTDDKEHLRKCTFSRISSNVRLKGHKNRSRTKADYVENLLRPYIEDGSVVLKAIPEGKSLFVVFISDIEEESK